MEILNLILHNFWSAKSTNLINFIALVNFIVINSLHNLSYLGLHHQQIILAIIDHVQLRLIIKLRLNVDVIFLSKYFRDERSRIKSLTWRWHHEWACVITGDSLMLLLKRGKGVMIQIDDWVGRWGQLACCLTEGWPTKRGGIIAGILVSASPWRGAVDVVELSHVLLQIKVAAESLRAYFALERLLVIVRVHMECQIVDLMKRLVTNLTFIRLLARVRQFVILVIPLLMEALAAELADVRLVPIVNSGVGVEGWRAIKRFPTCLTWND